MSKVPLCVLTSASTSPSVSILYIEEPVSKLSKTVELGTLNGIKKHRVAWWGKVRQGKQRKRNSGSQTKSVCTNQVTMNTKKKE